jgi:hypothetical protein
LNDIAERVNDLSNDIYFSKNTLKKLRYTLWKILNTHVPKEVSLTHLVREVDVQPIHSCSNPHRRRFEFLLFQNLNRCGASPAAFLFKKHTIPLWI